MNATLQLNYLIDHPINILRFFRQIFTFNLASTLNGLFNFFGANNPNHYSDHYDFITVLLWIFLAFTSLIVLLMVYVGTCFIQLLTWASVGGMALGVSTRYFLPLFALLPIIVPVKITKLDKFKDNYDKYAMIFIIGFMATLILAFATKYY